jgi:hypothetical protein
MNHTVLRDQDSSGNPTGLSMTRRALVIGALLCLAIGGVAEPTFAGKKKRDKHVEQWPDADLSAYSVLYVEEFEMTDPKAGLRKKQVQVMGAPKRLASYLEQVIDSKLFEVRRGRAEAPVPGALVLGGEITQYKPGSAFGRSMLAGVGSAHLDFTARITDADTGKEVTSFDSSRTWAWGGLYGMSKGVGDIEENIAYELSLYLQKCKTGEKGQL